MEQLPGVAAVEYASRQLVVGGGGPDLSGSPAHLHRVVVAALAGLDGGGAGESAHRGHLRIAFECPVEELDGYVVIIRCTGVGNRLVLVFVVGLVAVGDGNLLH